MATMPRFRVTRSTLLLATLIVSACLFFFFTDSSPRQLKPTGAGLVDHDDASKQRVLGHKDVASPHGHDNLAGQMAEVEEIMAESFNYGKDGIVKGWDRVHRRLRKKGLLHQERHPILELMERGRRRWETLLKRQSKTLPQAVTEYKKRYGRPPPRGFDKWFEFCKRNGVKIVDDYDQIDRDIRPWLGISPADFEKRRKELEVLPHSYSITLNPKGTSSLDGVRGSFVRPKQMFGMLEPLSPYLDREVTIYASDHDMGNTVIHDDLRAAALEAVEKGTFIPSAELKRLEDGLDHGLGMLASCSETSPARLHQWEENTEESQFVYDPRPRTDYCRYPELTKLHGAFTWPMRKGCKMRPVFQLSKLSQNHEFLLSPLEAYYNASSKDAMKATSEWSDKTISKLFWRGSTTGDHYTQPQKSRPDYDWRMSHRPRFHFFANGNEGNAQLWVKRPSGWHRERWSRSELNEHYFDAGVAGINQCEQKDGTCDIMKKEIIPKGKVSPEAAKAYKYVFDIDGNGWSSRYHRLLASNSVVIKNTIYPEWMSDWLTPWVHFIPCKLDFSDLYDIMSFFVGPPDSPEDGNDELAEKIASAGRKFTLDHWRWEDMQAYMLRLILEYQRLSAEDRSEWSYEP